LPQNILPELLQDVDPKTVIHKSILHECALSHFLLAILCTLQYVYGMMDKRGWPPHSADSSPLEFFLWGHTQTTAVYDVQDLQQRACNGFEIIRRTPEIFQTI
jgi:hypothetical protein